MGRATRWFKSILGLKKQNDKEKTPKTLSYEEGSREKVCKVEGRWSFTKVPSKEKVKKGKENEWCREYNVMENESDQTKHAIAVAAATAAAADAAVAAAQAAVAVVRLTSQGRGPLFVNAGGSKERFAAVMIQTRFRSYLARRALKALKGLVKLQAHVRGYLVRKRAAATLQSMQALIRAQASARSQRANLAFNRSNKIQPEFRSRKSMERFDDTRSDQFHSKRLSTSYEMYNNPYEGSPKIVEIDTFKPRSRSRRISPAMYDFSEDLQYPTMSSPLPIPYPGRMSIPDCPSTIHDSDWSFYGDECHISTAQTTPRFASSTRSNGPPTPTKSVCGDSFFRPYSNFPSYMANTQSFRAKLRSQSAPKQRPESRSKSRLSLDEIMAARNSTSGVRMQRSSSQVQDFSLNV